MRETPTGRGSVIGLPARTPRSASGPGDDVLGPVRTQAPGLLRHRGAMVIALPEQRPRAPDPAEMKPSAPYILQRSLMWLVLFVRFALGCLWDGMRGRGSRRRNARRLRDMFQKLGATAVKIGQQMSVRTDLLAMEYCEELEDLLEQVPPFPFEEARRIIEEDTGKPLSGSFRRFDPEPIGSGSIACVYRAILPDGLPVAVKVRRPGIGTKLTSDVIAMQALGWFVEAIGLARPGKWLGVFREMRRMLVDELDFTLEARQIEAFQRDARKVKHLSTPKVYFHLTNARILVTEFVEGVSVRQILNAVESGDLQQLARLHRQGYDPGVISRRWVRIFFWQIFDSRIFHADPHPANLIVRPGNTITIIDFGSCGSLAPEYRRNMFHFNQALVDGDVFSAVDRLIAMAEPLPPIDVESYKAEMASVVRKAIVAVNSRHTPWQEKTAGGVFRDIMDVSRRYGIPLKTDALRYFRANALSDSLAYRLYPQLDPVKEFEKWSARRAERLRRKIMDRWRRRQGHGLFDPIAIDRMSGIVSGLGEKLEQLGENLSYNFRQEVSKAAYTAGVVARGVAVAVGLVTASSIVHGLSDPGQPSESTFRFLLRNALAVMGQPWFLAITAVLLIVTARKVLLRLSEPDLDRKS